MLIGLLGGECTGKSTLARALVAALSADGRQAVVVPEALRGFVEAHGRPPEASEQAAIMAEQSGAVDEAVARWSGTAAPAVVIADPSAAMTAVYSTIYFADHALDAAAVVDLDRCSLVAWCQPDLPWEPDGLMRDGEHMRAAAHAAIEALLPATRTPVVAVSGTLAQRVASIRVAMARIGS